MATFLLSVVVIFFSTVFGGNTDRSRQKILHNVRVRTSFAFLTFEEVLPTPATISLFVNDVLEVRIKLFFSSHVFILTIVPI